LAERWPRAFAVYQYRRRPLKIGIDNDIAAAAGAITTDELKAALRFYCGNIGYLLACREGAERKPSFPSSTRPAAVVMFANGNNMRLVGDIIRRTILCSLNAERSVRNDARFATTRLPPCSPTAAATSPPHSPWPAHTSPQDARTS
jgi:hypothetical protein